MICCRSNRSLSTPPYDACSRSGYWIPKKAFLPPTVEFGITGPAKTASSTWKKHVPASRRHQRESVA